MTDRPRPMVSPQWLMKHLHDPSLRIVEASWHMPASGRDAREEFRAAHIPGAIYFDIDELSADSPLPHTLPASTDFAKAMGAVGISADHQIIVYDSVGLFSAARAWWMFRYFGAGNVRLLDGGLPSWRDAGGETTAQTLILPVCEFIPDVPMGRAVDSSDVLSASKQGTSTILDARSYSRFTGEENEPREGLRSGHVPGSCSLPFTALLQNGKLRSNEELQKQFDTVGVNPDTSVITTCGSGVTAAVISLALYCVGNDNVALYDGSWSEWGARDDLPVAQGGRS